MTDKKNLEKEFAVDLKKLMNEIIEKVYRPRLFISMVNELGAYEATKKTILKENTSGYLKIMEKKMPNLLIENLVINSKYKPLFTEEERILCRRRLGLSIRENENRIT